MLYNILLLFKHYKKYRLRKLFDRLMTKNVNRLTLRTSGKKAILNFMTCNFTHLNKNNEATKDIKVEQSESYIQRSNFIINYLLYHEFRKFQRECKVHCLSFLQNSFYRSTIHYFLLIFS